MKYLLLIIAIALFSCADDNITSVASLEGKWVEKVSRMDTLIFDSSLDDADSKYFVLKSEHEIAGYNDVHSSMFEYKIEDHKISIYNSLSSCYCFSDYSFRQQGNDLLIENFYDASSAGEIETFVKLASD